MARDSVKLPFLDGEHELRGKHVFRTIREIEDVITLTEIVVLSQRGAIPYARIASAYAVALKKAGATTDEEDVFDWLFEGGEGEDQNVFKALETLATIMVPPSARKAANVPDKGDGDAAAPLAKKPASLKQLSS